MPAVEVVQAARVAMKKIAGLLMAVRPRLVVFRVVRKCHTHLVTVLMVLYPIADRWQML